MSRRKSKATGDEDTGPSSVQSGGVVIPSSPHQNVSMGVSNISRSFDLTDGITSPSFVFRHIEPFTAFSEGWSATQDDVSGQDPLRFPGSTDPAETPFYPVTQYTRAWQDEMGPLYNRLFQAALTSYTAPPTYLTARYFAALLKSYVTMYSISVLNHLAYHFDWSTVYPYTGVTPKAMYDLAAQLGADDITMAQEWIPYMRILERHIMPPWLVAEAKRMLTPMHTVDLAGHILIPMAFDIGVENKTSMLNRVAFYEQTYEVICADVRRVTQAYLPYPLTEQGIWYVSDPVTDPLRLSGWFNSGNVNMDTYGDTGDPINSKVMTCDEADGYDCIHYTLQGTPTWEELKLAAVFELTDSVTDDEFMRLTPHHSGIIRFFDETLQSTLFDGTAAAFTDASFELGNFTFNRYWFNNSDVAYGIQQPGFVSCRVDRAAIITCLKNEVLDNFHYDDAATWGAMAAGANMRLRSRVIPNASA